MSKPIKKLTIRYEDGSERELNKGFVCTIIPQGNSVTKVDFDMINLRAVDEMKIILGVVPVVNKLRVGNFVNNDYE